MCGIVGAVTNRKIRQWLIDGLKKLEYRGYDSAGLAVLSKGELHRLRAEGKVQALADLAEESQLNGEVGIAHTRWATHGKPSVTNAHPHLSSEQIAVVHNGIIENHDELKLQLIEKGYRFESETDTEVAAHLIFECFKQEQDLLKATQNACKLMKGAFALGVMHQACPDKIVAFRKGSPLLVGQGSDGFYLASDAIALQGQVSKVVYLKEGQSAELNLNSVSVFDENAKPIDAQFEIIPAEAFASSKGQYRHFMQKEIAEQPRVIAETLQGRLSEHGVFQACFGTQATELLQRMKAVHIVACGTSYHAGFVAKYWIESLVGVPVHVEVASEYRYRDVVVPDETLFISVSQSGETADTLAALEKAKKTNYIGSLAVCNVPTSSLIRESDLSFLTRAGVEIGVASTKAFTTQLCAFLLLALSVNRRLSKEAVSEACQAIMHLPILTESILALEPAIKKFARYFVEKNHALFLGRGVHYPIALEGALKLKELSYIHAEAYPAGELKHGPLALVDKEMPVVAVAPNDSLLDKLKSNLEEVRARGGELFLFADNAAKFSNEPDIHVLEMPTVHPLISPIVYTIPLQILSYYVALLKGTDVDQPRNLAKSVTVE